MDDTAASNAPVNSWNSSGERQPLLVDVNEAARLLSVSRTTIFKLINADQFLPPIRLGRALRWNFRELEAWVDANCPPRHRWEAQRLRIALHEKRKK